MRTPSISELVGTAAEKITQRKWCGHCQAYKELENGMKRVVKGRKYWKCDSCNGKTQLKSLITIG